jgi:hypothetical protein
MRYDGRTMNNTLAALLLAAFALPVRADDATQGLRAMAAAPSAAAAAFDQAGPAGVPAPGDTAAAPAVPSVGTAAKAPHPIVAAAVPGPSSKASRNAEDDPAPIIIGLCAGLVVGGIVGFLAAGPIGAFIFAWFGCLLGAAVGLGIVKS